MILMPVQLPAVFGTRTAGQQSRVNAAAERAGPALIASMGRIRVAELEIETGMASTLK